MAVEFGVLGPLRVRVDDRPVPAGRGRVLPAASLLHAGEVVPADRLTVWSCQHLGDRAARVFRLLGLRTCPGVSLPAAARLAGLPLAEARRAGGASRARPTGGWATRARRNALAAFEELHHPVRAELGGLR
ncbi:hypothetical protein [Saccharothrix xinjiangensis]|uniref:Uncharacterized protein n=1 Tax=Saccharothrix xinjiangensis TaxID=204798 RepID=A0ABV9YAZ0_9PSEU